MLMIQMFDKTDWDTSWMLASTGRVWSTQLEMPFVSSLPSYVEIHILFSLVFSWDKFCVFACISGFWSTYAYCVLTGTAPAWSRQVEIHFVHAGMGGVWSSHIEIVCPRSHRRRILRSVLCPLCLCWVRSTIVVIHFVSSILWEGVNMHFLSLLAEELFG